MNIAERPININISTLTIFKLLLVFLVLYFLYLIRDIVVILFVSLILSSAIDPWVDWLQRRRIPRSLGMMLIYLVLFSLVGTIIYLMIPPIVEQLSQLAAKFPRYFEKLVSGFSSLKYYSAQYGISNTLESGLKELSTNLQNTATGLFSTVTGIFGGLISFVLILVLTFYMSVEENAVKKLVWSIAPEKHQTYIMNLIKRMQAKIGLWLRGQLILSFIIFLFTYTALTILGVEYALVLALAAGLLESIPYLGPILSAVPAIFLASAQSPMLALVVALAYYIIQWLENNILVPKIMQRAVGLSPIVIISALLIGFKLAGILGAVLAIPVATAASVAVEDLFNIKGEARNT